MNNRTVIFRTPTMGFILCSILVMSACKETPADANDTITYDYSYVNHYRSDFDASKFSIIKEYKNTRLLMMPNTITDAEAARISSNIDTMIDRICAYLNTSIANEYNGFKGKVSYFVEPGIIPRMYGGSSVPIVSITTDNNLSSLYQHETVHIFSLKTSSTWLIEGLAVHVADTLGVERLWPNYSESLHLHAKQFIGNQSALAYIGMTGFYGVEPTTATGEAFYTLSGSFVRYMMRNTSKADFMKCYSSADFKSSLLSVTKKSFDDWEKDWLNYLRTL